MNSFGLNGFRGDTAAAAAKEFCQLTNNPAIEAQLNGPSDVGKAHQFFQAGVARASDSIVAGAQAVSQQISPMIQLIMRMPGQIGLMNSVFEAFGNLIFPHAHLLSNIDAGSLIGHGAAASHLHAGSIVGEHMAIDPAILPQDAPIFGHDLGFAQGSEHSFDLSFTNQHVESNALNVSGSLDVGKSQIEGVSFIDSHGQAISGPAISDSNPAVHLSDDHLFAVDRSIASHANQLGQASHASSGLNVGASAFAQSGNSLSASAPVPGTTSAAQPVVAANNNLSESSQIAGQDKIVSQANDLLNKSAVAEPAKAVSTASGTNIGSGSEYGENYLKTQPSAGDAGLKAKELSLADGNSAVDKSNLTNNMAEKHIEGKHVSQAGRHAVKHSITHKQTTKTDKIGSSDGNAEQTGDGQAATSSNADNIAQAPKDANASVSTGAAASSVYTIRSGDCLWNIAKNHLGSALKWQDIYKMNGDVIGQNPDLIRPGVDLKLPSADQAIANHVTEASKYIVKSGDNLWDISRHFMHDGTKWGDLYKVNESVIGSNPRLILPGQELSIPTGTDASAVAGTAAQPGADQIVQAMPQATDAATAQALPAQASDAVAQGQVGVEAQISQSSQSAGAVSQSTSSAAAQASASQASVSMGPGAAGAATINQAQVVPAAHKSGVVSSSMLFEMKDFLKSRK